MRTGGFWCQILLPIFCDVEIFPDLRQKLVPYYKSYVKSLEFESLIIITVRLGKSVKYCLMKLSWNHLQGKIVLTWKSSYNKLLFKFQLF